MILRHGRNIALALALTGSMLTGACAKIKDHQGFIADESLITAIQPGVDNRDSVVATLGRPTFASQFGPSDWYYVSRDTRNMAFNMPKPSSQTVLRVRFDQAGNVVAVDRHGMEQVVAIDPSNDETPTLGRHTSFFEELFGNIGTVGSTGKGTTADNPN